MATKVWYAPNRHQAFGAEEIDAVSAALRDDGWLGGDGGPCVASFEKRTAALFGKAHSVFVNSGSSANELAAQVLCHSLKLGEGDEVITPALTFSTTVAPWERLARDRYVGLALVFCDVGAGRYVPDAVEVLRHVTPKTRVICLPNLIGEKPDWQAIRDGLDAAGRQDVVLFEDSCDVITETACTDVSTSSFYASHMITTGGGGGVLMFNDPKLLPLAHTIRDWGRGSGGGAAGYGEGSEGMAERFAHDVDGIPFDHKFLYHALGYNFKATEMAAAFGLAQLDKLDAFKAKRLAFFARYMDRLKDVEGVQLAVGDGWRDTLYMAFPLQTDRRMALFNHLEANGVQTRVLFSGNITRHPAYRRHYQAFPEADRVMRRGGLVGCHHGMTMADVDRVCDLIVAFFAVDPQHG